MIACSRINMEEFVRKQKELLGQIDEMLPASFRGQVCLHLRVGLFLHARRSLFPCSQVSFANGKSQAKLGFRCSYCRTQV